MDFVQQYYQMDPETEMVMFGRELTNGMEVLIESASCRADLATRPYSGTAEEELFNWRMNRWFKVARLIVADDYINFVSINSDDTEATQRWSADSGWIVKKYSVPEGWPFENGEGIAKKYCELKGLKMVPIEEGYKIEGPSAEKVVEAMRNAAAKIKRDSEGYIDKAGVAKWMEQQENLSELQVALGLKNAGYGTMAISQIMQITPDQVKEIIYGDRDALKPFFDKATRWMIADKLASGAFEAEVIPFQDGRDVTAIIKPGLNYRPTLAPPKDRRPEVFAEFMRMNAKFFDSRESVRLTDIAKMFNAVFCGGPGATLGWRLNYEELREMARPYWELCDEAPDEQCLPNCTFTNYQGFGLTAGQIMDRDMIQRGDPTKNSGELCTCSEHGPCPLHKTH